MLKFFFLSFLSLSLATTSLALQAPSSSSNGNSKKNSSVSKRHYYACDFDINASTAIKEKILGVSLLKTLESSPPLTAYGLRRRCKNDIENIKTLLKTFGYFKPTIDFKITHYPKEEQIRKEKSHVQFIVSAGPPCLIKDVIYKLPENCTITNLDEISHIKKGKRLVFDFIREACTRIIDYFRSYGYPFVSISDPDIALEPSLTEATLTINIDPHQKGFFADTTIVGLKDLNAHFIRNRLKWKKGELYNQQLLSHTHDTLFDSSLFSTLTLTPQDTHTSDVPIKLEVTEAPKNYLNLNASYNGYGGIGGNFLYTRNNFSGYGDSFGIDTLVQKYLQQTTINYIFPDLFVPLSTMKYDLEVKKQKTPGYKIKSGKTGLNYFYPFNHITTLGIGVEPEIYRAVRESFNYKGSDTIIPLKIKIDNSNSALNPTKGWRFDTTFELELGPYQVHNTQTEEIFNFSKLAKMILYGTYYLPLTQNDNAVIAFWSRYGKLIAASHNLDHIPPQKRFYAGGIGSVLAYSYQKLSPLDQYGVPTGGQSLFEGGAEFRYRFTENIQGSFAFEGGSVSAERSFKLARPLYGISVGALYFATPETPFRFNISFPFTKRSVILDGKKIHIDSPFQIGVSIGQMF